MKCMYSTIEMCVCSKSCDDRGLIYLNFLLFVIIDYDREYATLPFFFVCCLISNLWPEVLVLEPF